MPISVTPSSPTCAIAVGGEAITPDDLEKAVGDIILPGDRLLLRTDQNQNTMARPSG